MVLVDNGRSELLANAEEREVLHCIRCGACLNACPVFRNVGGHTYGTTYQGPIGSVLTPHLRGLGEFQHLSYASSLCGACTEVCPVKISLHHHLLRNRRNSVRTGNQPLRELLAFKMWRWTMMGARRFRLAGWLARRMLGAVRRLGLEGSAFDPMRAWTRYRAAPSVPRVSFRRLWKKRNEAN